MRPTKGGAGVLVGRGVGRVVGLDVGRRVGTAVAVGVFEGSGVTVMVGLNVGVGVSVGMGVSVATGVLVGVLDGVGVGEGVRVRVAVEVAVKVGFGVRVGVADSPACRSGRNSEREQASKTHISRMTTAIMMSRFFIFSPAGLIKPGFGRDRWNCPHYNCDLAFLQEGSNNQSSACQRAPASGNWDASMKRTGLTGETRCGTIIPDWGEETDGSRSSPDVCSDGN
jgi:hypothetical protein